VREFLHVRPRNTTLHGPVFSRHTVRIMPDAEHLRAYKQTLFHCLNYLDGTDLDVDEDAVPQERLQTLMPTDLLRWFNFKTFGIEDPPLDANPTHARSNSILAWKKQISYFMPNNHHPWNEVANIGNPTRSQELLKLVKYVKKKEVRGQGAPSHARRPLEEAEFRSAMSVARNSENNTSRYGIAALCCFQFSMIGRIDDCTQWEKDHFKVHDQFPDFAARARLTWSKNVREERDAPWQILLGSMDPLFCVLITVAIWLEWSLSSRPGAELSPYVLAFSHDNEKPRGGVKAKVTASKILRDIFHCDGFEINDDENKGPLGSHSLRKFASTWVRRNGGSKDDKDTRGRWKKRRVSDDYDDMELPYPDTKVAGMLCVGGPCSYRVKANCGVTDAWILANVVPNIARVYGNSLAKVLGKALLWCIFSERSEWVPHNIRVRVTTAYNAINNTLPNGENPIVKRTLIITGADAVVHITEVLDEPANQQGNIQQGEGGQQQRQEAGGTLETLSNRQLLQTLLGQVGILQRQITTLNQQRESDRVTSMHQSRIINDNIRRLSMNPIRCMNQGAAGGQPAGEGDGGGNIGNQAGGNQGGPPAELSSCPRTLYDLWREYEEGLGGRKAARLFTAQERGRVKHKYTRRKIVWDLIKVLIRSGLTYQLACDRIYHVYGQATPVTQIINRLKIDRTNGNLHPDLQVGAWANH
jgi:Transcriptional activator of glycolytic enzymes